MTWNPSLPADSSKLRLSAGYIRNNWAALESALGPSLKFGLTSQIIWIYADIIVGETASLWTIQSSLGDTLLAVKGGSTYTAGKTGKGTWTQTDHILVTNEIPAHTHQIQFVVDNIGTGGSAPRLRSGSPFITTTSTGGGAGHNHGNSWRPLARVGLLILKN